MKAINISGRKIGAGHPCFIVAEAGVNHNGSLDLAIKLVDAAVESGADAVKFQTFHTENLVTNSAPKAKYQIRNTDSGESQFEMIKRLELNDEEFQKISHHCTTKGIIFLSTPFEEGSADFLEKIDIPAYKMASGELTNLPFQAYVARKGKPMIVSTGMGILKEVDNVVNTIRGNGNPELILLHCTSNYPTDPKDVNLRAMVTLRETFNVVVGYSDHTEGKDISIAAVALGASVIEKHFTLDRTLTGPDQGISLEPDELKELIKSVRKIETALGSGIKKRTPGELNTALAARKSLHYGRDLPEGQILTINDLIALRPGSGISPARLEEFLGKKLNKSVRKGNKLHEVDCD
jgi:N-acetylneuraminate synthase/N,N'-diacetyllegionaminate synthase